MQESNAMSILGDDERTYLKKHFGVRVEATRLRLVDNVEVDDKKYLISLIDSFLDDMKNGNPKSVSFFINEAPRIANKNFLRLKDILDGQMKAKGISEKLLEKCLGNIETQGSSSRRKMSELRKFLLLIGIGTQNASSNSTGESTKNTNKVLAAIKAK